MLIHSDLLSFKLSLLFKEYSELDSINHRSLLSDEKYFLNKIKTTCILLYSMYFTLILNNLTAELIFAYTNNTH